MTSDELNRRIERLGRKLLVETDPEEREDLEASIAALEAQRQQLPPTQQISGHAQVGVAVAGNVTGSIYLNGYRSEDQQRILAAYLQRLVTHCDQLPLHALTDTTSAGVQGGVTLQTVYTQLVTTNLVPREDLADDVLRSYDLTAFLTKVTAAKRLPADQRTAVQAFQHGQDGAYRLIDDSLPSARSAGFGPSRELMLDTTAGSWVSDLAKRADRLVFSGPELVTEAVAANPHLVLLGEPGSGKSTALRFLALSLARIVQQEGGDPAVVLDGWSAGRLIPVYAPLLPFAHRLDQRGARRASADDLWNYLATRLNGVSKAQEPAQYPGTADALAHELQEGRVLLLLDGLDEVVGDQSRQAVTDAVLAFARAHPACRMVLACRIRAYEGPRNQAWQLPGWPTATLANWTQAQMDTFVTAWYRAAASTHGLTDAQREVRASALRTALVRRPDLRRLGERPLLLTIMALVHLSRDLPEDRASLYRVCIEKLLVEWERRGKEESDYGALTDYIGLEGRDIGALLPLLYKAAFIAHEAAERGSLGRIGRDQLRLLVMDELGVLGHLNPHMGAERFLTYTDHRAGLIQASDVGDAYAFPHQTFQEYLAGVQLVAQDSFVAAVMERRHDDRWETPIQLALGHLMANSTYQVIAELLEELLRGEGRSFPEQHRDILLAATLAADLGWKRLDAGNTTLRRRHHDLALALAQVVEGTTLTAAERVRAGVLLGSAGDPRPGVCDLERIPFVAFGRTQFVIGSSAAEADEAGQAYERSYLEQGNTETAEQARTWPHDEINQQSIDLAPFELARYPLTNAQYRLFIDADGYNASALWWGDAARTWLARADATTPDLKNYQKRQHKDRPEWWDHEHYGIARPNHPVVGISWYEATAFCRWLTLHRSDGFIYCLPSEAEWEYAARGAARRTFAWGDTEPDGERANFKNLYTGTTAVGCFPTGATAEGLLDMAGNVWEWNRNQYRYYPYDPTDGREDRTEPADKYFTLRGGGWNYLPICLRASDRRVNAPDYHNDYVGFRLARHAPVKH